LNIQRKDDLCGSIGGKNYYCSGYDHNDVYRNSAECAGANATGNALCTEVHSEKYCVPRDVAESLNACSTDTCHCIKDNANPGSHTDTWDYDQLSTDCQPSTDYIIQYSRVRQWEDYIATIESVHVSLQEEQDRFEETRCPFVRSIIKPEIELPAKPDLCSESFDLTQQLISNADITWIETLGTTVIRFNDQAAKVAANAVCSHSYSIVHTDPSKLISTLGLSSTTMAANCIETGVRSNICTTMGTD